MKRETWITGIGILSCLGEGRESHWQALADGKINFDKAGYPPYIVHPLPPMSFDAQIPKKGDQRQMEPWQRIGTYAAGLALDSAGVKGRPDILGRMDMIGAAGGGERGRARPGGRWRDPLRPRQGRQPGTLPQRAADERPAPDLVPGAAIEPAR